MCYGQSYNGASTMSAEISGPQTKIREVAPNAVFTHCCVHNLNLILMDAVSSNLKITFFFNHRNCIRFFSGSLPRLSVLKEEQCNHIIYFALTLKKLRN